MNYLTPKIPEFNDLNYLPVGFYFGRGAIFYL
jgi:hypothetical protein